MNPRELEQQLLRLEELWLDPEWDMVYGYKKATPKEEDAPDK